MLETSFGIAAASWGIVMALAPGLQIVRMVRRRSSDDVSIGYMAVLLPGFVLWICYGVTSADAALVVPNTVAVAMGATTIAVALRLRGRS